MGIYVRINTCQIKWQIDCPTECQNMSDRMLDRLSDGTDFRKNSEIKCQMHSEIERENISQK